MNLSSYFVFFRSKDTRIPIKIPRKTEPIKIPKKSPRASKTTNSEKFESLCTVEYNTIQTASLKILSPKMILYSLSSTFISFIIDRTATGSVAEIRNEKASRAIISISNTPS